MKKVITALFVAALVSVHGFALEFILTPTIGYSHLNFTGASPLRRFDFASMPGFGILSTQASSVEMQPRLSSSINAMSIGLAMGTVARNGFTFMWNNDIALLGSGTATLEFPDINNLKFDLDASLKKGVAFEQTFIFGRTFKAAADKLYINIGSGLAWGVAKINLKKEIKGITIYSKDIYDFNVGIPIQVGLQYFFTKNIGLNLTVSDVISLGISGGRDFPLPALPLKGSSSYSGQTFFYGFENVFTAKLGPVFKF